MITTLNNTTGDVCNSLKRSQFAGRPWRSKHCELLLSSSLNCHFKPHPLLISSLPFPFFFLWQIKFTRAMRACISQRRSFIRLPRRETPRRHIAETFPPYRRSTPAPHQLSGSAQKKKELEIDSSPTALALRDGVTWQSSIEMHGWRVMKRRWRGGEEEEARVEIQYIRT